MSKSENPRKHPPKAPPLTPAEEAVLSTMPVKYRPGRPSNKTRRLLAIIAYARLRFAQHQQESANGS